MARKRGAQIGAEYKGKGSHVILGPVAGPLGRSGYGGRNWEGFSPDPYLTGAFMEETILGIQGAGVQACAKRQYLVRIQQFDANELQITSATSKRRKETPASRQLTRPSRRSPLTSMTALCTSFTTGLLRMLYMLVWPP